MKKDYQDFDVTPLALQWVKEQFLQYVGDQSERAEHFRFNSRELGHDFAEFVHTFLLKHEIPAPADKTADISGYSRAHMYRILGKWCTKNRLSHNETQIWQECSNFAAEKKKEAKKNLEIYKLR